MIKKTLYFGNAKYLSIELNQLKIADPIDKQVRTIPIEDIGLIIVDHAQITFTQTVMTQLISNNAAIVWCGPNHMPISLTLPLADNDTFSEKIKYQLEASEPLKKQLWKQTIISKLCNQIAVLKSYQFPTTKIEKMVVRVASGDPDNYEGQAAAIYWNYLFEKYDTTRGRREGFPNHFFNYGYAILRAVIARNLVGSGCLPVMGIHHHNKYNAYCLADDIMEPYRPIVDKMIFSYLEDLTEFHFELQTYDKAYLMQIPVIDVIINNKKSPLMVGAQSTTASLMKCYKGEARKINYPVIKC